MDVADVLSKAWKAVKDAEIPEPLQELALGRAIDYLIGSPTVSTGSGSDVGQGHDSGSTGSTESGKTGGAANEKELYERMSAGTGVPVETLERLVHLDGGVPKVLLRKTQLPKKKGTAQKAITLLLSVATHYLTGDEEVSLTPIRQEVQDLNFYDANYMQNIGGIADILIGGTRGGNKTVKIRKAYLHSFKDELAKYDVLSE